MVSPKNEDEVRRVLAAAYRFAIPVTPRGAATGNYGQAMPLNGGVLLNLAEMNRVKSIALGRVVCEPGAILIDVDKALAASGQELRMFPSTRAHRLGRRLRRRRLRRRRLDHLGRLARFRQRHPAARADDGGKRRARSNSPAPICTRRCTPMAPTAIIVEVEMPLAPRYDWVDVILGFDDFETRVGLRRRARRRRTAS